MELFFVGHAPGPKQKVYTDQINVVVKNCANVYAINKGGSLTNLPHYLNLA